MTATTPLEVSQLGPEIPLTRGPMESVSRAIEDDRVWTKKSSSIDDEVWSSLYSARHGPFDGRSRTIARIAMEQDAFYLGVLPVNGNLDAVLTLWFYLVAI